MTAASLCPDLTAYEALLAGTVAAPAEEDLLRHLAQCDPCTAAVRSLLAHRPNAPVPPLLARALDEADSGGATQFCEASPEADPETTRPTLGAPASDAEDNPAPGAARTAASAATGDAPPGYPFLAPPRGPGELGWLGPYRILKRLGEGAMGLVFHAEDSVLKRPVALKVLRPELAPDDAFRRRFEKEVRAAAALHHDHIVTIYHVGHERAADGTDVPWLAMELLQGHPLDRWLENNRPSAAWTLRLGREIALALAAAHAQGLIHRDVKPGNIWVEEPSGRARLLDFGLVRAVDEEQGQSVQGLILGTPEYMAPEQTDGAVLDARCDLYSLGCVLYRLCTGAAPFAGRSLLAVIRAKEMGAPRPPCEANPEAPADLSGLVMQLLARDPARRPASARSVADALRTIAEGRPLKLPLETAPRPRRRKTGRRFLAGALLGGLCLLGAFFAVLAWRSASNRAVRTEETVPADALKREDLPLGLLALAGGGDPAQAPPELVAVLGEEGRFRLPNPGLSHFPARTADGSLLAVACGNDVALFDARTGALLRVFLGHTARASSPAFSTDGQWLACGSLNGLVRVWEVASGKERIVLRGHRGDIASVAFSHDGKRLASGGWADAAVKVWDLKDGKEAFPVEGHRDGVPLVRFSPDGKFLVSGAIDRQILVRDAISGKTLHALEGHTKTTFGLAFSANGKWLATGSDAEWKLWRTDTFAEVRSVKAVAGWLEFTPDGKTLLTARRDPYPEGTTHCFRRWNVPIGELLGEATLRSSGGWASYLLSADGKSLFSMRMGPAEPFVHVHDAITGKEAAPQAPLGHTGAVTGVAFSPDGRWLASGGADRSVRLWDLATGKLVRTLAGHTDKVWSVAFSPDGTLLASGSSNGGILLWDVARGAAVRGLAGHSPAASLLAFSPDGKTVAAGGADGAVRLWFIATGQPQPARVGGHKGVVRAVAFSPDGQLLASAGEDGKVRVCDAATGKQLRLFRAPASFLTLAFSPDGKRIAAGTSAPDKAVHIWDLKTGKGQSRPAGGDVAGPAFHPSGLALAVGTRNGMVSLRGDGPANGRMLLLGPGPFGNEIGGLAFSPEGRYLAVAQGNGLISVLRIPPAPEDYRPGPALGVPAPAWGAASPADALKREDVPPALDEVVAVLGEEGRFRLPTDGMCHGMAVSKGGERLAVPCGNDLAVFDARTGKLLHTLPEHASRTFEAAFSPDGKRVACGSENHSVRVWDVMSGRLELTLKGPMGWTHGIAFSPDGKRLAAACSDTTVWLWDADTGANPLILKGHDKQVNCVRFSPDGKWLVSGGFDRQVRVWEAATGKELHALTGHTQEVWCVAFSPDGKWLATGSDKEALLWDTRTFKDPRTLSAPAGWVTFAPNGNTLLTGVLRSPTGKDHTVIRWDVTTGKQLGRFSLPTSGDWASYALSPDGKDLFAMRDIPSEGFVRVYDAITGKERQALRGHTGRVHVLAVSPDGKVLASAGEDEVIHLWGLSTGRLERSLQGCAGTVRGLAIRPDGKWLASQGADKSLRLWSLTQGKEAAVLERVKANGGGLAFSPDGRWLASPSYWDGGVRLWDVAEGKLVRVFRGQTGRAMGVAFSSDGRLLACGGTDRTVRIWDVASGWQVRELRGHGEQVNAVRFSPDGRHLATGGADGAVKRWDAMTGAEVGSPMQFGKQVQEIIFGPEGRWLAAVAQDGTLRLRDSALGSKREWAFRFPVTPLAMAATPARRYLAVSFSDGLISILRAPNLPLDYRPAPASLPEPAKLAERPSAADALKRVDVPAGAPAELVAVLGEKVRFRLPSRGGGHGMAVSNGGERLAVPCGNDLAIFDARTGKLLHTLPEHKSQTWQAAFSPDGKRVACGSQNHSVRVWDVRSGRLELTLKGPKGWTHGIAFSPDGKRLAAASFDSTVWLWDADTGENPLTLKGRDNLVFSVCFSPDGKWLVSGGDQQARVWDAATGKELHALTGHTSQVRCVAFSPDGKWLATGSDKEALLWNATTFKAPRSLPAAAGWLTFTPDGKTLLTGAHQSPKGKAVMCWDVTKKTQLRQFFLPFFAEYAVYALSPDGKDLFALDSWPSCEPFVHVYDAVTGKERAPQRPDSGSPLGCVAVSPDGRLLAAGSSHPATTTVRIFDLTTGKLQARWAGHGNFVRAVVFSPDGKLLASTGEDGRIRVREIATGKERLTFQAHNGSSNSLAFSPDGALLCSGSLDRTARLWDVRSGRLLRTLIGHEDIVEGVAFSPDGKVLATAGYDRTVRLWDVTSGWQLAVLTGHTGWVRSVAFHPGGKLLASGSLDRTVRLWDATTGQLKQVLKGHAGEVVKVAWRADGRVLASCGGADGTARLWQVDGGSSRSKVFPLFRPGAGWVHGVAFTPEGRHLLTANPDGTVAVLRLAQRGEVFNVPKTKRGNDLKNKKKTE